MLRLKHNLITYHQDTQKKVINQALIKEQSTFHLNTKGRTTELVTKQDHITDDPAIGVDITSQAIIEDHTTDELTIEEEDMSEDITTGIIEDTHHQRDTDLHTLLQNIPEVNMFHPITEDHNTLHQSTSHLFITQSFIDHQCISHLFTDQNDIPHQSTAIVHTFQA